jgi:hypothetical protein
MPLHYPPAGGATGPTGPTGAAGATGPTGAAGSSPTQQFVVDAFGALPAEDDEAFVTGFATATSPVTKSGAGLNGAVGATALDVPRPVTIALSMRANSYVMQAITVTGVDAATGAGATSQVTPSSVNGGETLMTPRCFLSVTSVAFPAQGNTSGQFKIGIPDRWGLLNKPVTGTPIILDYEIDFNVTSIAQLQRLSTTEHPPYGALKDVSTPPDGGSVFQAAYMKDLT